MTDCVGYIKKTKNNFYLDSTGDSVECQKCNSINIIEVGTRSICQDCGYSWGKDES